MMTLLMNLYFLQSKISFESQSIILIAFLVFIIYVTGRSFKLKKVEIDSESHNSFIDKTITQDDMRLSALELIKAGNKLIAAFLISIITVLGNYLFLQSYFLRSGLAYSDLQYIEDAYTVLYFIDFIISIIVLYQVFSGYYCIKNAGKKILKD